MPPLVLYILLLILILVLLFSIVFYNQNHQGIASRQLANNADCDTYCARLRETEPDPHGPGSLTCQSTYCAEKYFTECFPCTVDTLDNVTRCPTAASMIQAIDATCTTGNASCANACADLHQRYPTSVCTSVFCDATYPTCLVSGTCTLTNIKDTNACGTRADIEAAFVTGGCDPAAPSQVCTEACADWTSVDSTIIHCTHYYCKQVDCDCAPSGTLGVYWAGWNNMTFDGTPPLDYIYLAFANIDENNQVDTTVSKFFDDVDTYNTWTKKALASPSTRFLLSVGGATFDDIWKTMSTSNLDARAKAIADTVAVAYPVDGGGSVYIDGVDLDIEIGDNTCLVPYVSVLTSFIKTLRAYLGPSKLLVLTLLHVGAATTSTCSAGRSSSCYGSTSHHCGEARTLLSNVRNDIDFVNTMLYSAGATFDWQSAATDFVVAMGGDASKVVVGMTSMTDYGGVQYAPSDAAARVVWANAQGMRGTFLWALAKSTNTKGTPYQFLTAMYDANQ